LRENFDLVLLDAPPVLALADARQISRHADTTLLCVRWRHTPRAVVGYTLEALAEAGARVAGIALTRVDTVELRRRGSVDADIYHRRYNGYFVE
jgi:Mrp family chromosome partitioning ATPase